MKILVVACFGLASLVGSCDRTPHQPAPGPKTAESGSKDPGAPERTGDATEEGGDWEPTPDDAASAGPEPPSGVSRIGRFEPMASGPAGAAFERLRKVVAKKGGKLHAALVDLELGRTWISHRAAEPVNPASNMKLLTAAAALDLLGPAFTFETELLGSIGEDGRAERLVLRGGGDPALSTADLFRLAQAAREQGLVSVGTIEVDQNLFSGSFVPPAFEQQPGEWAAFRAPISAASLEGNTVTLNVLATRAGQPARVWYEPPGVVRPLGSVVTGASGSGERVRWSLDAKKDPTWLESTVSGSLAEGSGRMRVARRLEDPRRAPGLALQALLQNLGIEVPGEVSLASAASRLPRLAYLRSAPLAELLRPLGKDSDNFTAETLFVALSAAQGKKGEPWSSALGAKALLGWLQGGNISTTGLVIENGSGLFDANRLSVETLVLVLARMEARPEVFPEYLTQLAVYGTDGTLRRRMQHAGFRSRVRAKTGTLSGIDALSGYVLRPAGARPLVFSLVVSGARGAHAELRGAMDQAVFAWAALSEESELRASPAPPSERAIPGSNGPRPPGPPGE